MKKFNVLILNGYDKKPEPYDVLPYFRREWRNKRGAFGKEKVKTKVDLKEWILHAAKYQYWARCEYEFLIAPWPFGRKVITEKLQQCIDEKIDLSDYSNSIKFYNIIMQDMYKIDIFEQIEMNIDIITGILAEEFKIK